MRERTPDSIPVYKRRRNTALLLGGFLVAAGLKLSDKYYNPGVAIAALGGTIGLLGGTYNQSNIDLIKNPEKYSVPSRQDVTVEEIDVPILEAA